MKRFIYFFFLVNILWSQQISVSDLKNLSNNELDQIKEELQSKNKQVVQSDLIENQDAIDVVQIESKQVKVEDTEYFGYNYFVQDINFFDNIPTPSDFKLGPGDEVIISLWGETNQRNNYIIDRNGMIFFENIGFVHLLITIPITIKTSFGSFFFVRTPIHTDMQVIHFAFPHVLLTNQYNVLPFSNPQRHPFSSTLKHT